LSCFGEDGLLHRSRQRLHNRVSCVCLCYERAQYCDSECPANSYLEGGIRTCLGLCFSRDCLYHFDSVQHIGSNSNCLPFEYQELCRIGANCVLNRCCQSLHNCLSCCSFFYTSGLTRHVQRCIFARRIIYQHRFRHVTRRGCRTYSIEP
jgi:hypothetical protein